MLVCCKLILACFLPGRLVVLGGRNCVCVYICARARVCFVCVLDSWAAVTLCRYIFQLLMCCLQVVLATVWDNEESGSPQSKYGETVKTLVFLWAIWSAGLSGELNQSG